MRHFASRLMRLFLAALETTNEVLTQKRPDEKEGQGQEGQEAGRGVIGVGGGTKGGVTEEATEAAVATGGG